MKRITLIIATVVTLISCGKKQPIVEEHFVDSFLQHHTPSITAITTEQDLLFWKKRVDSLPPDLVNKQRYAQALAARFHLYGDITDLLAADSIYNQLNLFYKSKEPGVLRTLASYNMLQHRFTEAVQILDTALQIKPGDFATRLMLCDANLELGKNFEAAAIINFKFDPKSYAYNFRKAKQDHYYNRLDSAIAHMLRAAELANSPDLKQAALTNAGDLYIHAGKLNEAYAIFKQCLIENSSDFHSLGRIAWIALVNDNKPGVAKKVFTFISTKIKSPDPLWRLSQITELEDAASAISYANSFVSIATQPQYGNMYNKYLIDLYTGILNQPSKAVALAQQEIKERATPQTYAWLTWSLAANKQIAEAQHIYQQHVSGKPLEAQELFWMGKTMQLLNKQYQAKQFFAAAAKNKYDLSPKQQMELEE